MFDRLKKLFGQAQSNETVAQVTTQVQQGVDAVQATATNLAGSVNTVANNVVANTQEIVADVKDAHAEVMADGKVDMNDLGTVKETVQEVATNVQEMVNPNTTTPTPTVPTPTV